jgi:histidinol-phosphate aminotransferase
MSIHNFTPALRIRLPKGFLERPVDMTDHGSPVRDEVRQIARYNAGLTIADVQSRYAPERISKLGSNENPIGPSPAVQIALAAYLGSVHIYPDPSGRVLRAELGQQFNVDPQRIVLGNGSEDLLSVICRTALRPGDRMVTLYPSFPLHEDYATVMGASVERIGLRDDFSIDVEALIAAVKTGPRMVMFANPMNPVGSWLSPDDLARVIVALPAETLLVIDEAYAEYAAGPDYPSTPELLKSNTGNWVALRTFSKAWGLAGLRIGYGVVGNAALTDFFDRVRTPFNTNGAAQAAALAALGDPDHVADVVALALGERARLRQELEARGYRVAPSKGNFLFFDAGCDAGELSERLLQQGVIVKPWKQPGYTRFIRVSMGSIAENDHFLTALAVSKL